MRLEEVLRQFTKIERYQYNNSTYYKMIGKRDPDKLLDIFRNNLYIKTCGDKGDKPQ
jgi:hypothetical protein